MINSAKQNKSKKKRRESLKKDQGKEPERSWLAYAAGTDPKTT